MSPLVQAVTDILSIATLFGDIAVLFIISVVVIRFLFGPKQGIERILNFIDRYAIFFGFLVSLSAVLASVFYSQVAGFKPCTLCWWQRIFIYPQVVIFALAWIKKDRNALYYSIVLSAIGTLFAAYHTFIQFGGQHFFECDIANPCTQRYFLEFGFVTIPTMALTSFLLLLMLMTVKIIKKH